MKDSCIKLIPGTKLCTACRLTIQKRLKDEEQKELNENGDEENCDEDDECERTVVLDERERLNRTLNEMEISPLKLHSLPQHSRHIEGKRKLTQVKNKFENSVATVLSIDQGTLHESKSDDLAPDLHQKANDLDKLMSLIKEKMTVSNREKKVQMLTLIPLSWTYEKIVSFFPNVTKYMVRQSRKLLNEKGILSKPDQRKGKTLPQETILNRFNPFIAMTSSAV